MVSSGDAVWSGGPLTRAIKDGAIRYLDEVVEARHDSLAVLRSLTDHLRTRYLDRAGAGVKVPDSFMLVCSYNPAYRSSLKALKPSFPAALRHGGDELPAARARRVLARAAQPPPVIESPHQEGS